MVLLIAGLLDACHLLLPRLVPGLVYLKFPLQCLGHDETSGNEREQRIGLKMRAQEPSACPAYPLSRASLKKQQSHTNLNTCFARQSNLKRNSHKRRDAAVVLECLCEGSRACGANPILAEASKHGKSDRAACQLQHHGQDGSHKDHLLQFADAVVVGDCLRNCNCTRFANGILGKAACALKEGQVETGTASVWTAVVAEEKNVALKSRSNSETY